MADRRYSPTIAEAEALPPLRHCSVPEQRFHEWI
jgi:hypothetical protein